MVTRVQPALEPALREREATNGEPKDGATITSNLGMAYPARAVGSRSGRSSLRMGEPSTWRRTTGANSQKRWLTRMGQETDVGEALKRRRASREPDALKGACQ